MTSNSKAELLFWLSADNRLLGFDSVFAIDKTKTDTLLTQEYIRRFSTASYLPPVSGETAPDNNYKIHMQGFVLDHPRLSFDNADITDSRASLRMKIVGGNQVDLKQAGEHWYPRRMDRIGPLTGPELRLRLELGAVPGYVDEGGHVILDLSNSDDFVLTFAQSNRIRQLGGEFFKEIFMALPDEQRVWSLGRIEPGDDDLLRPESFFLRTQRNPSASFSPMAEGDWASFCTLSFSFKPRKSNGWQELSATFQFDLTTLFHLVEPTPEESAGCLLLGQVLWPWQQTAEVQPVSGLPEGLSELEKQEICAFVAYLIKQAVLEGLARKLSALVPEQVLEKLSLAGAASLEHTAFEMPHGVALFANGGGTADWRIADAPHVLAAAQRHTFTVEPAGEAVSWTVEPLPGNLGDFGRIDESSGEYRAPPAHAMGGQPARLLIVATGRDSGLRSSKLLTVTLAALTVNPLIRVCYVGDELSLTAGTTAGDLQWSLADPDAEGRGTVRPEADGLRCTYIAGSPVEDNRTYVLDQVLVQSPGAGEPRTVHMLVRQRRPEMVVEVAEQLPDGSLQFQGRVAGNVVKGVRWSTPVADSGSIDPDTGHYTPPGDAGPGFVLVMARLEILDLELLFEGHLVLPLPLALHADAMRRLAQPAGLRFGKPETSGE
ncbi:hypothetical protein ACLPJF_08340 [Pseudomonas vlassakiae]|uniref:hypothetical protein n=1 Tax=Pseudomonas TaxID=286 RepID=UPI0015B18774|nr:MULTISPECIES: hypothetical protein [unclassified Pseudomonas]MBS3186324.1 hypothetical protein [Pseudomonas sp. PCH44]